MIVMIINKSTKEIYMGKSDGKAESDIVIDDMVQVNWMQTQDDRITPVPSDYLRFLDSMVMSSALPTQFTFDIKNYIIFEEAALLKPMCDWYVQVMAKKSGIEIVGAGVNGKNGSPIIL